MKIACNSADVQTETINFTFARQAALGLLCISKFVPTTDVAMTVQRYNLEQLAATICCDKAKTSETV